MTRYFGPNIRFLRRTKNLSQEKLASELDITRNRVVSYEKGATEPRLEVLVRLSLYFGVTVDDLLSKDLSATEELAAANRKFARLSSRNSESKENDAEMDLSFDNVEALQEFIRKSQEVEMMFAGFRAFNQLREGQKPSNGEETSIINRENLLNLLEYLLEANSTFIDSISNKK
ncbi:MAG: helix-turn-helix transcriptional regulator [Saprospiraceae bacterium]|nr:helix-turn-helix transcriptional regulator [Saprospiraceae bacterium]